MVQSLNWVNFIKNLYFVIIIFLAVGVAGCGTIKGLTSSNKSKNQSVLSINFNKGLGQSPKSLQLEIYFIRNAYLICSNKTGQLTHLMNQLNAKGLSGYEVISYYSYNIMPNKILRDLIAIEKNVQAVLVVLKEQDKLVNKKLYKINPNKAKIINIELIDTQIKTKITSI